MPKPDTGRDEFPESTSENRDKIGCYGSDAEVYDQCWCGYSVVLGFGQCPECRDKQAGSRRS